MNDPIDHDELGRRLGQRLREITAHLEPRPEAAMVRHRSIRPVWITAVAGGLVAATVMALVMWNARGPAGDRVSSAPTAAPITVLGAETLPPTTEVTTAESSTSTSGVAPLVETTNILVVGLDGRCGQPADPAADIGDRSDTILVIRVEPDHRRAEMLSFQRDLWVAIAGTDRNSRLNSAMVRDDPTRLIATLMLNFGIPVDHFVQVDFCSTVDVVDAIGGVDVPFDQPVRDRHTGFEASAGCVRLDGDQALAYLRSRYLEVRGDDGTWQMDPRSDLSRIDRQQDFVRRLLQASLERGLTDPSVLQSLLPTVQDHLVVDSGLTIDRMLELGRALADLDGPIVGYQLPVTGRTISGNAVLLPDLDDPAAQAMLATFGGTQSDATTSDTTAPIEPAPTAATAATDAIDDGRIVPDSTVTCPG